MRPGAATISCPDQGGGAHEGNEQIGAATGLLGRWGMNEGNGTGINNTAAEDPNGTLSGETWSRATPFNEYLVVTGATWKYLDDGSDQGTAWRGVAFDDSTWSSGPAQLGYGDGDEATLVGYGPDANNKYITTWFRRSFTATNVTNFSQLTARVVRDDGVAAYVNNSAIYTNNLPFGTPLPHPGSHECGRIAVPYFVASGLICVALVEMLLRKPGAADGPSRPSI